MKIAWLCLATRAGKDGESPVNDDTPNACLMPVGVEPLLRLSASVFPN